MREFFEDINPFRALMSVVFLLAFWFKFEYKWSMYGGIDSADGWMWILFGFACNGFFIANWVWEIRQFRKR